MKKIDIAKFIAVCALAAGLARASRAQSAPAAADAGPGLIGADYSEVDVGAQRHRGSPRSLSDLGFAYNKSVVKTGGLGLDAGVSFDHASGGDHGLRDRRDELLGGFTAYLMEPWGKPFVSADAGWAWQRAAGESHDGFAFDVRGGAEFQVLRDLALTPYIEFQGQPPLHDQPPPSNGFRGHEWDLGLKATYRITQQWSASLTATSDRLGGADLGLRAGVAYRF